MSEQQDARGARNLAREKAIYRYITALDGGDIDSLIAVLHLAERDGALEDMILEVHEVYQQEDSTTERIRTKMESQIDARGVQEVHRQSAIGRHVPIAPIRGLRPRQLFVQAFMAVALVCIVVGGFLGVESWYHSSTGKQNPLPTGVNTIRSWCAVASPNPGTGDDYLSGVAALSQRDAWVVGSYSNGANGADRTLVEHWNGANWSVIASPNVGSGNNSLEAVTAISATNMWAVGLFNMKKDVSQPLIEHWDGVRWQVVSGPEVKNSTGVADSLLMGVTAIAPDDIWAVGSYNSGTIGPFLPIYEHWNGIKWSLIFTPTTFPAGGNLNAVAASSSTNAWTVGFSVQGNGSSALLAHWDGSRWNIVHDAAAGKIFLGGVAVLAADNAWAVGQAVTTDAQGDITHTLIEHWDGTHWNVVSSPNPGSRTDQPTLFAVAGSPASNVWAVGTDQTDNASNTLIEQWDGHHWSIVPSQNGTASYNNLQAVAVLSPNVAWAIGISYKGRSQQTGLIVQPRTLIEAPCP